MRHKHCAVIAAWPLRTTRFTNSPQCGMVSTMNGRRTEPSTFAVLAINADKVVENRQAVPASEVAQLIADFQARHGTDIRILVNGVALEAYTVARGPAAVPLQGKTAVQVLEDGKEGELLGVQVAHAMLWDTYDRAARVQSWMLETASAFTLDLLNNNKRLADQAGELQKRYQTALAEIDYMAREQKLMEGEAAATRLSRHLIEKARAEIAAANPTRSADWIDDLIDGAAVVLGSLAGPTRPRDPKDSN